MTENGSKNNKPGKKNGKAAASKAIWTFPKNTLEDALRIPQAIEQQNAGNPMKTDVLVKAVGFNSTSDWRFLDLLKSANLYGLVEGSGRQANVSITSIGNDVIAPGSPTQRQAALLSAFRQVEDFNKVEAFYKGKKLPEDEFFENTLVREFKIPRERVQSFIQIFTKNLEFLKAFKAGDNSQPIVDEQTHQDSGSLVQSKKILSEDTEKGRTFLDTCFVMMPFGTWPDQYYKDIFSPAIKDAGMEPLRADELFSTGTVIEQIWEQIEKAKILLADLTGKNANVFYELGLAHAARKPVVFTTANLEDVPFDLRHLRVIVYDVNDPFWGDKLKASLSSYLKNAKNDPDKSIPQPFRLKDR
ncbi:MAG: hypothetical protein FGM57_02755 [Candidatus Taylorbacteria bacterium]|nr:hypothetical protein [Candidatus Taylorbacteria bacterium]